MSDNRGREVVVESEAIAIAAGDWRGVVNTMRADI